MRLIKELVFFEDINVRNHNGYLDPTEELGCLIVPKCLIYNTLLLFSLYCFPLRTSLLVYIYIYFFLLTISLTGKVLPIVHNRMIVIMRYTFYIHTFNLSDITKTHSYSTNM